MKCVVLSMCNVRVRGLMATAGEGTSSIPESPPAWFDCDKDHVQSGDMPVTVTVAFFIARIFVAVADNVRGGDC